jgi:hypothetical protein
MATRLGKLLGDLGIRPMLMDVGASGKPPTIWKDIAPYSTYIGFDPDLREIHEDQSSGFYRSVILNEAVTADKNASEIGFYLTHSPFCSTTLAPNPPATAPWLERGCFAVEGRATVRATTIDRALTRLNIPRIDWIKLDTQGTDLRLINSLSADVFSRLMAIDTEPGLVEIYQCEDLFVDVHRDLIRKGFWLSSMHTDGLIRMRRGTLEILKQKNPEIDDRYIRSATNVTPAYHEARYLRTLEWLADHSMTQQEYVLLWVFALADGQLGFALDISVEFENVFGETEASVELTAVTWLLMSKVRRRRALKSASLPVARGFRSVLGLLID